MTDKLTPQQRHRCMKANKPKGTKPELMLSHELWRRGYRYRRNMKNVAGSPDICFKRLKLAVFVDGEFWHGRNWESASLRIKSNREYWIPKIERNMERDKEVDRRLNDQGWQVLRFWESDVKNNLSGCADKVIEILNGLKLGHLHRVYLYDTQYESPCLAAEQDAEWNNYE